MSATIAVNPELATAAARGAQINPFEGYSVGDFYTATLDAVAANVAILDADGVILAVNAAWRASVERHGVTAPHHGLGADYFALNAAVLDAVDAEAVKQGLLGLIDGAPSPFRRLSRASPQGETRWHRLTAIRFGPAHAPLLITAHEDVTEMKQAEIGLQETMARLLVAEDNERRRIARELHDGTAQTLVAVKLMLGRFESAEVQRRQVDPVIIEASAMIGRALDEIRTFSYLLHPPELDHVGLVAAVQQYARGFSKRSGVAVSVEVLGDFPPLPDLAGIALYRVIQEALANIHRHSGSASAVITLTVEGGWCLLTIRDHGCGLPPDIAAAPDTASGVGLAGMRLRLRHLGGALDFDSSAEGLLIRVRLPLDAIVDPLR